MSARSFGVLGFGLLLAVLSGGWILRASGETDAAARAEAHVQKTCVGCHPGKRLDEVVRRRIGPDGKDSLDAFLATHHVADPSLRSDVVVYLKTRVALPSS